MAREMTNFTNANILQQAATAMLAQANALPQNVLSSSANNRSPLNAYRREKPGFPGFFYGFH